MSSDEESRGPPPDRGAGGGGAPGRLGWNDPEDLALRDFPLKGKGTTCELRSEVGAWETASGRRYSMPAGDSSSYEYADARRRSAGSRTVYVREVEVELVMPTDSLDRLNALVAGSHEGRKTRTALVSLGIA